MQWREKGEGEGEGEGERGGEREGERGGEREREREGEGGGRAAVTGAPPSLACNILSHWFLSLPGQSSSSARAASPSSDLAGPHRSAGPVSVPCWSPRYGTRTAHSAASPVCVLRNTRGSQTCSRTNISHPVPLTLTLAVW